MAVTFAIHKGKAQNRPFEAAFTKFGLRYDFASRISLFWVDCIGLSARMLVISIIDIGRARHNEASIWGMGLCGSDKITRALHIASPYQIVIRSAKNGSKVNDS